jgi:hypothetical protein
MAEFFLINRRQTQTFSRATCSAKTSNRFAIKQNENSFSLKVPPASNGVIGLTTLCIAYEPDIISFLSRAAG